MSKLLKELDVIGSQAQELKQKMAELEDAVIEKFNNTGNMNYIIHFYVNAKGMINMEKMEDAVIAQIKTPNIIPIRNSLIIHFTHFKGVTLSKFEDLAISRRKVSLIIALASSEYMYGQVNIDKLQKAIIGMGNSAIYNFAKEVSGANITELEDGLIATNNGEYIYEFARDIEGANVPKLEDALITAAIKDRNGKYGWDICSFAFLKGADMEKCIKGLVDSKDNICLRHLLKSIEDYKKCKINMTQIDKLVLDTKDYVYICSYAKEFSRKDILKNLPHVQTPREALEEYDFVKEYKKVAKRSAIESINTIDNTVDDEQLSQQKINIINKLISKAKDEYWKNKRSAMFIAVEDYVVENLDIDSITKFGNEVKGADKEKLKEAILKLQKEEEKQVVTVMFK